MSQAVEVHELSKVFNPGTTKQVDALVEIDLAVSLGEFVSLDRPVRLRQVDAAAADRQPHRAVARRGARQRQAGVAGPPRPGLRHGVPTGRTVRLAQRGQERRTAARAEGLGPHQPAPAGDGDAAARQARRLRRAPAVAALGWHAAARRDREGAGRPARSCC
ncbi:MAG: hypothetical protein WKF58_02560 [Ilumatobacteraceae bacterium]